MNNCLGNTNGQIIIWKCSEDSLNPTLLMIGHASPVTAISAVSTNPSSSLVYLKPYLLLLLVSRFVSASLDGHLSLWDIDDGRCVDTVETTYIHRKMQTYVSFSIYLCLY